MPIFEFRCHKCGKEFERLVFASDKGSVPCPQCGSESTERVLSVFASNATGKMASGSCATGSCASKPSTGFS